MNALIRRACLSNTRSVSARKTVTKSRVTSKEDEVPVREKKEDEVPPHKLIILLMYPLSPFVNYKYYCSIDQTVVP